MEIVEEDTNVLIVTKTGMVSVLQLKSIDYKAGGKGLKTCNITDKTVS